VRTRIVICFLDRICVNSSYQQTSLVRVGSVHS